MSKRALITSSVSKSARFLLVQLPPCDIVDALFSTSLIRYRDSLFIKLRTFNFSGNLLLLIEKNKSLIETIMVCALRRYGSTKFQNHYEVSELSLGGYDALK